MAHKSSSKLLRTPGGQSMAELARAHTRMAIDVLAQVISNRNASAATRAAAAIAMLDRGWGRAGQDLGVDPEPDLAEILAAARRRVDEGKARYAEEDRLRALSGG